MKTVANRRMMQPSVSNEIFLLQKRNTRSQGGQNKSDAEEKKGAAFLETGRALMERDSREISDVVLTDGGPNFGLSAIQALASSRCKKREQSSPGRILSLRGWTQRANIEAASRPGHGRETGIER